MSTPLACPMPITSGAPTAHALPDPPPGAAGVLTIDLGAIAANWRALQAKVGAACRCTAVVKADAYGLGAKPVTRALIEAGCRHFFVATLGEGIALAESLADRPDIRIAVLDGAAPGTVPELLAHRLIPVLNEPGQVRAWIDEAPGHPAMLQLDSGMSRLGLSAPQLEVLDDAGALKALRLQAVISHLACPDAPDHILNAGQRRQFEAMAKRLPGVPQSLASSCGIFLGSAFHYDMVRPGAALWGLNPTPDAPNPMHHVVGLKAKIIQSLEIEARQSVGYGASYVAPGPRRLVTVAVGYADGIPRAAGNRAEAYLGRARIKIVGRISMDLVTLDVTGLPEPETRPGRFVDLIGPDYDADALARDGDTIGYEILTRLSRRLHRSYLA
jgi:alanine racemase